MTLFASVRMIAQEMIRVQSISTPVTSALIRSSIESTLSMVPGAMGVVDAEELLRDLEARFNTWVGIGSVMESNDDHLVWLANRRTDIQWDLWERYREFLLAEKGFEPTVLQRLGELTDSILERLEDPLRAGKWLRKGLVVGQVQSGKTANYTGLLCKAIDSGYKLIVVLTGIHNSLRSQTQLRLDEGIIGLDTRRQLAVNSNDESHRIGVGLRPWPRPLIVNCLTTSAEKGDFKKHIAENAGIIPGGNDPLILVVKKNGSVLKNLYEWARAVAGIQVEGGQWQVRDVPMLLLDDEADIASINTKKIPTGSDGSVPEDYDVTAINAGIRRFLNLFAKRAYVGYTATPFANVFIHPDGSTISHGEDLFPDAFIVNLPAPSNYIGPANIFGMPEDPEVDIEGSEGMDVVVSVDDQDSWMPLGHNKDHVPITLPASLKRAIRAFVVSCAARAARGQDKAHKSMLIHVTRFQNVQGRVIDLLREELTRVVNRLEFDPSGPDSLIDELSDLWRDEFIPVSRKLGRFSETGDGRWEEVRLHLLTEAKKIQLRLLNGSARDALEYKENEVHGLSVIAVGGDKLSRGLTLEGLSVSYYLRASRMYDTLMQMGRWFGYRPGYEDLCRLFTSSELTDWYREITLASEELRREFEIMAFQGLTPREYGLRVRSSPNGLLITAANKLRNGISVDLSYQGDLSETILFDRDGDILKSNIRSTELLVRDMGGATAATALGEDRGGHKWTGIPGARIAAFLESYRTHPATRKAKSKLLAQYIRAQLAQGELVEWTVGLMFKKGDPQSSLGGVSGGLVERAAFPSGEFPKDRFSIRQLHSPNHEAIDLTDEEMAAARKLSPNFNPLDPASDFVPSGITVRQARSKTRGLLLVYPLVHRDSSVDLPPIGLVLSFPQSETAHTIPYVVNNVYWEQEFGD